MQKIAVNPYRERVDFSRIKAMIPIPNLIEIQRKSYDRFLQMNLLATERQDLGLQAVFKSIFPITDFRENCELQFVEYAIGVWECKCGKLEGLSHLRRKCTSCGATIRTNPLGDREIACSSCGKGNENRGSICDTCGESLSVRKDDREEVVAERMRVYRDETAPLLDHYETMGNLNRVDGTGSPDEVLRRLLELVETVSAACNNS